MADYWVSLPKHYCEYCKVWCQGDPASVKHHEGGKKHKDTVSRFLFDRKKSKLDEDRKQREIEKELREIDKAARQAVGLDRPKFGYPQPVAAAPYAGAAPVPDEWKQSAAREGTPSSSSIPLPASMRNLLGADDAAVVQRPPPPPPPPTGQFGSVPFVAQYLVDSSVPPPPPPDSDDEHDDEDEDDEEDLDELDLVPPPPPSAPPPPPPPDETPSGAGLARPAVVPDAPDNPDALYGTWQTVTVEEVDEEQAEQAKKDLERAVREHATGRKEAPDGKPPLLSNKFDNDGDGDPVDAFSTYNPFGGAYKGINLDADEKLPVVGGARLPTPGLPAPTTATPALSAIPVSVEEEGQEDVDFKKRKRPAGIMQKRKQFKT